tara:strand:+ start:611 stop:1369 length:759 start_codon:yes stop_codon:yes gene_type:complete
MPRNNTIDEIKYNFDQGARGNRFDVFFYLPVSFGEGGDARGMGIRVESCELPGRSISTTSFKEFGAERSMPDGTIDDGGTTDMTFICDQAFADRFIIEAWHSLVYSADANADGFAQKQGNQIQPIFSYYKDYIGKIQINQNRTDHRGGDDSKGVALTYELHDCYPTDFSSQDLSVDGSLMKFTVTFAYRYWTCEYNKNVHKRSFLNKGRVILDSLLDGSNILSRFGKEGKVRRTLTNLDTRSSQLNNIFGGG